MSEYITTEILDGLEEALEAGGGTHALSDVLAAIRSGKAQLWSDGENALVTEINCAPREKELHFWVATGTLDGCIALSNKVMRWGRDQGCTIASLTGRPGWARALAREGWSFRMVQLGRRLTGDDDGEGQDADHHADSGP